MARQNVMPCSLGQGQILNLPQMCISPIRANGPAICLAQPEGLGTDPQYHKGLNARPFATRLHNRTFTVRKTNDADVYADVGKLPGRWPSISHFVYDPALQAGLGKLPGRCPCFKFDPHDRQWTKTRIPHNKRLKLGFRLNPIFKMRSNWLQTRTVFVQIVSWPAFYPVHLVHPVKFQVSVPVIPENQIPFMM